MNAKPHHSQLSDQQPFFNSRIKTKKKFGESRLSIKNLTSEVEAEDSILNEKSEHPWTLTSFQKQVAKEILAIDSQNKQMRKQTAPHIKPFKRKGNMNNNLCLINDHFNKNLDKRRKSIQRSGDRKTPQIMGIQQMSPRSNFKTNVMKVEEPCRSSLTLTKEVNPNALQQQRNNWLKGMKQKNLNRENMISQERISTKNLALSRKSSNLDQAFIQDPKVKLETQDLIISSKTLMKLEHDSLSPIITKPPIALEKLPSIRQSIDKNDSYISKSKKRKKKQIKKPEDSLNLYIGETSRLAPLGPKAKKKGANADYPSYFDCYTAQLGEKQKKQLLRPSGTANLMKQTMMFLPGQSQTAAKPKTQSLQRTILNTIEKKGCELYELPLTVPMFRNQQNKNLNQYSTVNNNQFKMKEKQEKTNNRRTLDSIDHEAKLPNGIQRKNLVSSGVAKDKSISQNGIQESPRKSQASKHISPIEQQSRKVALTANVGTRKQTNLGTRKPSNDQEVGGEDVNKNFVTITAEKEDRPGRSSSIHETPFQGRFSEQVDLERKQMQLENFLGNLTLKSTKNNTQSSYTNKSRDLNRIFLKRLEPIPDRVPNASPEKHTSIEREEPHSQTQEDKIICLIKTNEPHLKRAVERRSQYYYNNNSKYPGSGAVFDIKFEFQDQPADYSTANLRPCQMFNHFQYNTEITTKSGLCKNLYNNSHPGMKIDSWFPRCYDLSQTGGTEELIEDYQRTSAQIIIKKHYQMFKLLCKETMNQAYEKRMKMKSMKTYNYREDKNNLDWSMIQQLPCAANILINTKQLERAMKLCKQILKNQYSETGMNDLVQNEFKPKDSFASHYQYNSWGLSKMYNEKGWQQILGYSKVEFPVTDMNTLPQELMPSKKELKALQKVVSNPCPKENEGQIFIDGDHGWERPNLLTICKVLKFHKEMKNKIPQYSTDGTRNVWIVKPCYNARGFGIYCIDNCVQEFMTFMKNSQAQSKIVMKYIEKPLLLNHFDEIRKFDIRQWVLVTSYDPLEIYIFDEFYIRICGSKYELSDIQDSYKHLTNFTIQKHNSKVTNKAEDLVMSQKEFFQKSFKNDPKKCEKVRKGIEQVIIKTIRTGQEAGIEHRPNCFEIYGFDFMLDQKLNPWLLEVNLSPACAERTEFLINMLDRMATGLFDHLEKKISKVSDDFKGDIKAYLSQKRTPNPCWQLIYDQKKSDNYKKFMKCNAQELAIQGSAAKQQSSETQQVFQNREMQFNMELQAIKMQPRIERKVQQLYQQDMAVRIIQNRYRALRAKKVVMNMKFELIVIYLQSYVRMFLAKRLKLNLKQQLKSVTIQRYLRKYLAKKVYFKLRSQAYDNMVTEKIRMIQRQARKYIVKQRQIHKNQNQKMTIIKSFAKGYLERKKFKEYRSMICKIRLIQKFYKRRLSMRHKKAVIVQKFIKGQKKYRKYQRLAKVKEGTKSILE